MSTYLFLIKIFRLWQLIVLFFCFISSISQAQTYPSKPIHIYVGQSAGGGMDTLARLIGQKISAGLGQPVIIENKVGAAGMIATEFVAKSPADGYSLIMAPTGNMVFNPILISRIRYSPTKDFIPVSLVSTFPLVLIVNAKQPFKNVADLVSFVKANPMQSNYGGSGPAFQFATELFKLNTDIPGEFIQYKSTSETVVAVASGDLLFSLVDTGPVIPSLSSGKLKALAVTSAKRLPSLPQVPTMRELGLAQVEFDYWAGLFVPAGTPKDIVKILEKEINRVVTLPDVIKQMDSIQVNPTSSSSEELSKLLNEDLIRWKNVADKAKIKLQD
jgi:tripartite-type tricarboxylate transporter receptor subunit TctC